MLSTVAKIVLPPDIAETVLHLVAEGDYPDSDSVIREAFDLLDRRRESARLWASIEAADRSIDEGHGIPWDNETKARIIAEGKELARNGVSPDPDVIP